MFKCSAVYFCMRTNIPAKKHLSLRTKYIRMKFSELKLQDNVLEALDSMGFDECTPIQ